MTVSENAPGSLEQAYRRVREAAGDKTPEDDVIHSPGEHATGRAEATVAGRPCEASAHSSSVVVGHTAHAPD